MLKKIFLAIIVLILVGFGGFYAYDKVFAPKIPVQEDNTSQGITYRNEEYGFELTLPRTWQGYTIDGGKRWDGVIIDAPHPEGPDYDGPMIFIVNPQLKSEYRFQGIPIMVINPDVWKLISEEKVSVSAAPIGPAKIGENSKYIFATPPRYIGFGDDLSAGEIEQIYEIVKTFKAF